MCRDYRYLANGLPHRFLYESVGTPDEQRVADAWKAAMEDV